MGEERFTPPVRLLTRKTVYENAVWRAFSDHIRNGTGAEITDFLVLEPKGSGTDRVAGVGILPVFRDRLVLHRAYRHALEDWFWEIPRGFVDPGESPEAAARRELEEEAGLLCGPDDLRRLARIAPEPSTIIGLAVLFVAENCREGGVRDRLEPGLGECRAFTRTEALDLIRRDEIRDSQTHIALIRYLLGP